MRILLTNDDGIQSPGIAELASVLGQRHEVWVVAPSANRSGASCSLALGTPLPLERTAERWYALDGSPVDCVLSALKGGYAGGGFDVVISGINSDSNLGTDVIYSGTCGAARQASLSGVPGIALSIARDRGQDDARGRYTALATIARDNLGTLVALCGTRHAAAQGGSYPFFANVNALSGGPYRGLLPAVLSRRLYSDTVAVAQNGGKVYSCYRGTAPAKTLPQDGLSDGEVVERGYVAVTSVVSEPSCGALAPQVLGSGQAAGQGVDHG